MKPNDDFLHLSDQFWATVKFLGQQIGYTDRKSKEIKIPSPDEIQKELKKLNLFLDKNAFQLLHPYFEYRAIALATITREKLMTGEKAKTLFEDSLRRLNPTCPIPKNKQSGEKKVPAYFTGLINMVIEANLEGISCDYDPRHLPFFTQNNKPIRTMSRRVDGAFPAIINPIAIWEIKEYYYTTTFGSRIADAVYETTLDGMELERLRESNGIAVKHYLMVDAYDTWWEMGKSYLCRIIDILHMGYADEILFGYEVIDRLPELVREWAKIYQDHLSQDHLR